MRELESIRVEELMLALDVLNQSELLEAPISPSSVSSMPKNFAVKDLKSTMKTVNDLELLEQKMKPIGKTEDLQERFLNALKELDGQSLPEEVYEFLKQPLVDLFTEEVERLGNTGADLPVEVINFYNFLYADEAAGGAKEKEEKPKKPGRPKKPPVTEEEKAAAGAKKAARSAKTKKWRDLAEKLIAKGKHTPPQIADLVTEECDYVTRSTVLTAVSDAKNPKYNVFSKLAQSDENGVMSFKE